MMGYWLGIFIACASESSGVLGKAITEENVGTELCRNFEHWKQSGISEDALRQGLTYFRDHIDLFPNKKSIAIADYSLSSTKKRFFVFHWEDGAVEKVHVSHGSGAQGKTKWGDPDHDGFLDTCMHNGDPTNMTRVGFFRVAEYYHSTNHTPKQWPFLSIEGEQKNINGLRLDGLSSTNKQARSRGVVMHEATYNTGRVMGRSYGCPAFRPSEGAEIMPAFAHGGMYYSYVPRCEAQQEEVLKEVEDWEQTCSEL